MDPGGHGPGAGPGTAVAVATSEHPVPAHAVAECAGDLLERSPHGYGTLLCFVGGPFGGALGDIVAALGELLGASEVAGVESHGLLMGGRLAEGTPALAVMAFEGVPVTLRYSEPAAIEDPAGGIGTSYDTGDEATFEVVFADPSGVPCQRPSPPGVLPAVPGRVAAPERGLAASRVGGFLRTGPTSGTTGAGDPERATRVVIGGTEHRGGSLCFGVPLDVATIHLLNGTCVIGGEMVVTETSDGHLVSLNDLPAAEALEGLVASMDFEVVEGMHELGFTVPEDDRLVAVRRSRRGLQTSLPVSVGTTLVPSVRSGAASTDQLGHALQKCGTGAALVLVSEGFHLGFPYPDYQELAAECDARAAGLRVRAVLWGHSPHPEILPRSAVVVGF